MGLRRQAKVTFSCRRRVVADVAAYGFIGAFSEQDRRSRR
jgi:hypothetical protein